MNFNSVNTLEAPFVQKETYYLDKDLNIVRVKFSFHHSGEQVVIKLDGHRFGDDNVNQLELKDIILNKEALMRELSEAIDAHMEKLGPIDVKVAPLDALIQVSVKEIPGLFQHIDVYGGDISIDEKRHALIRTRLKASMEGIRVEALGIVSKNDNASASGNITNAIYSLNGARSERVIAKSIEMAYARDLKDFDFFTFRSTIRGFDVSQDYYQENPERESAARSLLQIPKDMLSPKYTEPSLEEILQHISLTRDSDVSLILASRKKDLDIELEF